MAQATVSPQILGFCRLNPACLHYYLIVELTLICFYLWLEAPLQIKLDRTGSVDINVHPTGGLLVHPAGFVYPGRRRRFASLLG